MSKRLIHFFLIIVVIQQELYPISAQVDREVSFCYDIAIFLQVIYSKTFSLNYKMSSMFYNFRSGPVKVAQHPKDVFAKVKREFLVFPVFLGIEGLAEFQENSDVKAPGDPKGRKEASVNGDLKVLKVTEETMAYQVSEELQEYR